MHMRCYLQASHSPPYNINILRSEQLDQVEHFHRAGYNFIIRASWPTPLGMAMYAIATRPLILEANVVCMQMMLQLVEN